MKAAFTLDAQECTKETAPTLTQNAAPDPVFSPGSSLTRAAAFNTSGRIVGFVPNLGPLVDFPLNPSGVLLLARSIVPLAETSVGHDVALTFEDGDLTRPLILGLLQNFADPATPLAPASAAPAPFEVAVDDHRLLLTAKDEIVLRCGRASITLTAAGKVLIRGEYVLSRSTGPNRIKGGSVQIN